MSIADTLTPVFERYRDPVARIEALATLLDSAWAIPGTRIRFGVDAALGLVPGLGDAVSQGLALYLIWEARNLGLPGSALWRMVGNVAVDTAIGAVPLVGDLADIAFRANRRNLAIIREHIGQAPNR